MSGDCFGPGWDTLAKYETEDSQLPANQSGEKRIVFMGDSIVDGIDLL